jgi:hypothetical protein
MKSLKSNSGEYLLAEVSNSSIINYLKNNVEQQLSKRSSLNAQKTLIKIPHTQIAETDHFGVQIEHLNKVLIKY